MALVPFGRRFDGALAATLTGILDRVLDRGELSLSERERLDGRTVLLTGASRGLGRATAVELARRGAHLILPLRSLAQETAEHVRRASLGGIVETAKLDLTDLGSVERLALELAEDGVELDVAILNAGIVPSGSRRTRDGFDEMFQVNVLANVLLSRRLVDRGVLPRLAGSSGPEAGDRRVNDLPSRRPRLVFVSSESHRGARPVVPERLHEARTYGMSAVVAEYGHGKLILETFASELSRRIHPDVAVHTTCPGAVATGLAREAPAWVKPVLDPTMRAFFRSPESASFPLVYLAASEAIEAESGLYVHVKARKARDERADDPALGRATWDALERILARAGHDLTATVDA